ncbi:amino acid permease/ SLC12A domain-containing protein [Nemania sp. FL0916]|nr:amino acid permease/ SLC12A domain-containing protein [Nemania sp. FL0916]
MAPTLGSHATLVGPASRAPACLNKVITTRQFVLMAIGSSVGAGLLVSTGQALAVSGPAPVFITFNIIGLAVWITMCSLGELSTNFPVRGSFYEFSVRFISPSWGFAMGWNIVMNYVFIVPFEIIVMVMCVRFWDPDISAFCLAPLFVFGLAIIYAFGAKWYAEAENIFGILKILVIGAFVVTALCVLAGAVPTDTRPAGQLAYQSWRSEAFKNGTPGFLFAFMASGMAYGGTEMLGLTAAECRSPNYVMKLASTLVAGRIALLYIIPVLLLGLVLKIDIAPADTSREASISPFVLAVSQAKISILPDLMNAVIVVAVFSMANASIFAASRALQAISARGMGPHFCASLHWDRPLGALAVVFAFSLLSFAKASPHGDDVFMWLLSLVSCCNYLTWSSICVAQIRCRLALTRQGRVLDNPEAYRSPFGIVGSVLAVAVFVFGLAAQITTGANNPMPSPPPVAASFTGLAVVTVLWVGYMIYKRDNMLLVPLSQIDVGPKEGIFVASNAFDMEGPDVRETGLARADTMEIG